MSNTQWTAVDDYFNSLFIGSDPTMDAVLAYSDAQGLPQINVSPAQGNFLMLLAKVQKASRILEIGTLGAYSTIWLAKALPEDGQIITLEADPHHAKIAQENLESAGITDKVTLHLGPATESLQKMIDAKTPPFDFIFIDADKPNNPTYLKLCKQLSRSGTLIIADNVARRGQILNEHSADANIQGLRTFSQNVAEDNALEAAAMQTVGSKGYDGFAMIYVK
jgi:predicted O-methyltransferase YrrM